MTPGFGFRKPGTFFLFTLCIRPGAVPSPLGKLAFQVKFGAAKYLFTKNLQNIQKPLDKKLEIVYDIPVTKMRCKKK